MTSQFYIFLRLQLSPIYPRPNFSKIPLLPLQLRSLSRIRNINQSEGAYQVAEFQTHDGFKISACVNWDKALDLQHSQIYFRKSEDTMLATRTAATCRNTVPPPSAGPCVGANESDSCELQQATVKVATCPSEKTEITLKPQFKERRKNQKNRRSPPGNRTQE